MTQLTLVGCQTKQAVNCYTYEHLWAVPKIAYWCHLMCGWRTRWFWKFFWCLDVCDQGTVAASWCLQFAESHQLQSAYACSHTLSLWQTCGVPLFCQRSKLQNGLDHQLSSSESASFCWYLYLVWPPIWGRPLRALLPPGMINDASTSSPEAWLMVSGSASSCKAYHKSLAQCSQAFLNSVWTSGLIIAIKSV